MGRGAEVCVLLEMEIVKELDPARWGQRETWAQVRSAENDPDPGNNRARGLTSVLSRLPELAFVSRVPVGGPAPRVLAVDTMAHGQRFGIGARFLDSRVEPAAASIEVELIIEHGASRVSAPLRLQRTERSFQSPIVRLLPGALAVDEDGTGIHAPAGATLRVVYDPSDDRPPHYRLEGERTAEAMVEVTPS